MREPGNQTASSDEQTMQGSASDPLSTADQNVSLHGIRIGDRRRSARGWLIVADGAVRGILTAGQDGEILFSLACDRRIAANDAIGFRHLNEAQAWLEKRLPKLPRRPRRARIGGTAPVDERVRPETLQQAERALLAAATEYCWTIRDWALPDEGPLRRLWDAAVDYRRLAPRRPGGA